MKNLVKAKKENNNERTRYKNITKSFKYQKEC